MRVLTSPADTGAVVLALPQDVQPEAFDYPAELFEKRVWTVPRPRGDAAAVRRAAEWIREAKQPLIVAGGGVLYSEATEVLRRFVAQTGIPVGETMAGKGSLRYDSPQSVGAIGVTGTPGANILAREADLVIGIGTRYSDFTTASKTAFQNPAVRFVNINVAEFDAHKHAALPVVADARVAIEELQAALGDYRVSDEYRARAANFNESWDQEVARIYNLKHGPPVSQGEVIGVVNEVSAARDVVINAAGSAPGDLHKLWRTRDPKGYHLEYGYSTMGYEIAGGLGVKLADPSRDVWVLVGDGSYLMMSQEISTSVECGVKLNIVVIDNHGFSSIGGLSAACGSGGFGTRYNVHADFCSNAASLGARACRVRTRDELREACEAMKSHERTSVVVIETDPDARVGGYESWWDVPVAEVSEIEEVQRARREWEAGRKRERYFL
jgi:3D-(3,5/4)-trihydroxycyclohexane-1,2-dione acylhydrolase (decyclizing)